MEILIGLATIIIVALIFFRLIVPMFESLFGMGTMSLGIWIIVILLVVIASKM